jgi:hypothetical protein
LHKKYAPKICTAYAVHNFCAYAVTNQFKSFYLTFSLCVPVSFEKDIGIYCIESSCKEDSKIDNVCTFSTIANVRSFPGTAGRYVGARSSVRKLVTSVNRSVSNFGVSPRKNADDFSTDRPWHRDRRFRAIPTFSCSLNIHLYLPKSLFETIVAIQ